LQSGEDESGFMPSLGTPWANRRVRSIERGEKAITIEKLFELFLEGSAFG
jgi:hypothetical protein